MVIIDSTASSFRPKRRGSGARKRQRRRHRLRRRSAKLVESGRVELLLPGEQAGNSQPRGRKAVAHG